MKVGGVVRESCGESGSWEAGRGQGCSGHGAGVRALGTGRKAAQEREVGRRWGLRGGRARVRSGNRG